MTVLVSPAPPTILQFFNNQGQPNVGGSILTQVGSVNFPTYEDHLGATPLPNPIPLNSRGEISNAAGASKQLWLRSGVAYAMTQYDADGNQINQAPYVISPPPGLSVVNVQQYGATGDGTTDDTAAIVACIAANPGRAIYFPAGTYKITSTITVTSAGTKLFGDGINVTYISNAATNGDAIVFTPATITTNATYLSSCGFFGMTIIRSNGATSGAGLRLTQCEGFILSDTKVYQFPEGITVEGGQQNKLDRFTVWFFNGSPVAGSSLLRFTSKQALDASYRQAWTTQISNFVLSSNKGADTNILIQACDGLNFVNAYVAYANQSLVRIKPNVNGENVSAVRFSNTYLDGVSQSTGTANGIEILDDTFSGGCLVNDVDFAGITFCGNLTGKGIYSTHPSIQTLTLDPSKFTNVAGVEVDLESGQTTGIIGAWVNWTPTVTFATPGDLSVAYNTQLGRLVRTKDGSIFANFDLIATPTFSTATGQLRMDGLPLSAAISLEPSAGPLSAFSNVTKAGYTNFGVRKDAGNTYVFFEASGSGVSIDTINAADVTTATAMALRGSVTYQRGEGA